MSHDQWKDNPAFLNAMFKPGESGNPSGRAHGPLWTTIIKRMMDIETKAEDPQTGEMRVMTLSELAVLAMYKQACKGNTKAFKELIERIDGKVCQPVSGPNGESIPMTPLTVIVEGASPDKKDE